MSAKRVLLVCMEALVIAGVVGCTPTIISSDAGVYQHGTMYAVSSKDMDAVYQASLQAMDKLELKVTDKMKDVFGAKVLAKTADGKIITVKIKPTQENKTMYSIKVGAFGNEERSRKIYAEIDTNLGAKK